MKSAGPRPLLLGHRGSRTIAPENTLEAITHAADVGADGVEIDIRPCAGGELVVFHDASLKRMTAKKDLRPIASLSKAELAGIDLGDGARIPALLDVMALCRERGLLLNVEVKRDVPSRRSAVIAAARALRSYRLDHLVVSSFDPVMLAGLSVLAPNVPIGLLLAKEDRISKRLGPLAQPMGAAAVHPEHSLIDRSRVKRWQEQGLRVVAWTVNELPRMVALAEMGVDAIITDDPKTAVAGLTGRSRAACSHPAALPD